MGFRDHFGRSQQVDEDEDDENVAEEQNTEEEGYEDDQPQMSDAEQGDNEEDEAGEEQEDEEEAGGEEEHAELEDEDQEAAGEIVAIRDVDAGLNDEETRAELAAVYDPNNGDIPSDEEEAIKNHTFDVTVRSATIHGDYFELKGKIDSGADANCISLEAAERHEMEILAEDAGFQQTFKTGSGDRAAPRGQVLLKFSAGQDEQVHHEHFHVIENLGEDVLLGHPFIERTGAVKLKGKFKDTPDEAAEREGDEDPEIDLMALQPPSKKTIAKGSSSAGAIDQAQAEKRGQRPKPS